MSYSLGIEIIRSREGFLPRPSLNGLVGFRMDSRCLMLSALQSSHRFRLQFLLFVDQTEHCKQNNAAGRRWLLPFVSEKRKKGNCESVIEVKPPVWQVDRSSDASSLRLGSWECHRKPSPSLSHSREGVKLCRFCLPRQKHALFWPWAGLLEPAAVAAQHRNRKRRAAKPCPPSV